MIKPTIIASGMPVALKSVSNGSPCFNTQAFGPLASLSTITDVKVYSEFKNLMVWLARLLSFLFLLVTLLPLLPSGKWYIRWWDFPRLQIAVSLLLLAVIWSFNFLRVRHRKLWAEPTAWVVLLIIAFSWQSSHIVPFSWVYPKEVPDSVTSESKAIKIVVANIDFENVEAADKVVRELEALDADLLLLVETNEAWMTSLQPFRSSYSHHFDHVQGEGLGMSLWSKFPILTHEKRRLVSERRVSLVDRD